MVSFIPRRLAAALLLVLSLHFSGSAATFTGSNNSGTFRDFTVTVPAGSTNLSLVLPGGASAYSHLLVRRESAPSDTVYDFSSQVMGNTNALYLEAPEITPGNYVVRVRTPAGSGTHNFSLQADFNQTGLRTAAKPVTKPLTSMATGNTPANTWNYYRVEVRTNVTGLRLSLYSTNTSYPDLFVARNVLPTTGGNLKGSTGQTNDFIVLNATEAAPAIYFIGVFTPSGAPAVNYELRTELLEINTLDWDPGVTHAGTEVFSKTNTLPGEFYFKIQTQNSAVGAWRTILNVVTGEASLFMSRGTLPSSSAAQIRSERPGHDGVLLGLGATGNAGFLPGEEWYIVVRANSNSVWNLVSGAPYVQNLGLIAPDASSGSGPVEIGPEGIRYFRTIGTTNTLAWRLYLNGATNGIYVRRSLVPVPGAGPNFTDFTQNGQMLVVPQYLQDGQYHVGVVGIPGTTINLDSREHDYEVIPFGGVTNITVTGYGYKTFAVDVPSSLEAWQVNVVVSNGNPNVAVRKGRIPNEFFNEGFSEAGGRITDSVTLVPKPPNTSGGLSDGTWFITVYANGTNSFSLFNGRPTITDIDFVDSYTNEETNRIGWRYFRVQGGQLGTVLWELSLSNSVPGTRIAVRRVNVPAIWGTRNPQLTTETHLDVMSDSDFLQLPNHQEDTWYIGVYNPSNILGNFTLHSRAITPTLLNGDGATATRTDVRSKYWQYFRVTIPSNIFGWDLRLVNVTSGLPRLFIRRDLLPQLTAVPVNTLSATNWTSGLQWSPLDDWTKRAFSELGSTNEQGRVAAAGMGRPLEPGTYYVGVYNPTSTNDMSYTIRSRYIGGSIPVVDLTFTNGSATNFALPPREAAYYRVVVPPQTPTWKVSMAPITGEAMIAYSTNGIPPSDTDKRVQKDGKEHFSLFPKDGIGTLPAGTNWIVVIGEGDGPTGPNQIASGTTAYTVTSHGRVPERDLGILSDGSEIVFNDSAEGGEVKAYYFSLPEGAQGYELFMENPTGNPWAVATWGEAYPDPGFFSEPYGHEGGEDNPLLTESTSFNLIHGTSERFKRIAVMARPESVNGRPTYPDASYTLRVKLISFTDLEFNNGIADVNIPAEEEWKFFRVTVPSDTLGWDLRMTNVQSGSPRMIISKTGIGLGSIPDILADRISSWPDGGEWEIGRDWTERMFGADESFEFGQVAGMGMGRPLRAGTYFISVYNGSFVPVTAQIWSRGIGPNYTIPVQTLPFNGSVTVSDVPPRNPTYFEVEVPENQQSWKVSVDALIGESLLIVSKEIPNILASSILSVTNTAGRKMLKPGSENFHLLPPAGQTTIPGGRYYVTVVSEGVVVNNGTIGDGTSSFRVNSHGPAPINDLGTVSETAIVRSNTLPAGDTIFYAFNVPTNVTRVEARLENRVGNPTMVSHFAPLLPAPGVAQGTFPQDLYGYEGGEVTSNQVHNTSLQILNPSQGTYYLAVKARPVGFAHTNASFTLRLTALGGGTALDFDGGFLKITNHASGTWRYFLVEVPTNAVGWDLRITNVLSGLPKMSIRRGVLPTTQLAMIGLSAASTSWAVSNQWVANQDWTRRSFSTNGAVSEDGRIAAFGMGSPLQPGTYYIGVTSGPGSATNLSYTISSRGIGDEFSIPIVEIPYAGGSATNEFLPPREAAYYRVVVPSNSPSLKMKLSVTSGEAMLVARRDRLPNADTVQANSDIALGKGMQKPGNEHLVILPLNNETNILAATNYFVVIGEGANASAPNRIGTGSSSFVLSSEGPLVVQDLGYVSSSDTLHIDSAEAGEVRAYEFAAQPGSWGMEVKLEERSGNPVMVLRAKTDLRAYLPDPGIASPFAAADPYGNVGGNSAVLGVHPTIITKANALPVTHYLVVKPRAVTGSPTSDASYRLRIREILTPELNFDAAGNTNGLTNSVSGALENNQRAFYRVFIPETNYNGQPVLGWRLHVSQSSGLAEIRVRKDTLPEDGAATAFSKAAQVLVPPYLTTGVYYVEVRGSNSTAFTLTSSALELNRPSWVMPERGTTNVAPGLTFPLFGDSGVETNGVPLEGNGSLFLEQGNVDYYGFIVPTQNVGLVKVYLESVSGNPDVFMRHGLPPTVHHTLTYNPGTVTDRRMEALTSEYANWVPSDKSEFALKPGTYYLAVFAKGTANARYRLRLTAGNITTVDPRGTALTNQLVANTDWIYYRVPVPTSVPYRLQVSWFQETGDLDMHVRDTVPPGNGATSLAGEIKDWVSDRKNEAGAGTYQVYANAGTYVLSAPPVRLGTDLYFGFRAARDSTFRVSFTNLVEGMPIPEIDFYAGAINTSVPGHTELLYRVFAPEDARRWRHSSTHTTNIQVYIEQGTLPTRNTFDDYRGVTNNSGLSRDLYSGWPWITNITYFISVTNTSAAAEPFQLAMDGRDAQTDDNDNDLLPDEWEIRYFRSVAIIPNSDPDADGVTNYEEYLQGTEPNNRNSFRARLIILTSNGQVTKDPNQINYDLGSTVTLTAIPANGYSFVRWTGTDNTSENPLTVLMNSHRTNTAIFKIRGDDFITREFLQSATSVTNSSIGASKEPGEPNHAGNSGGRSIWWRWTASIDEQITISTRGSSFNTLLAVYTGDSVSNLVLIAADDNGELNLASKVTFNATAGTTYAIAVDGVNGASGRVELSINGTPPTQPIRFLSPARLSDGRFQFTIGGDAGVNLEVQYSTNLTHWVRLTNITTTGTSTVFTDSQTGQARRFYRLQRN